MSVLVAKWGNALGVRLPAFVVKQSGLQAGDYVEVKPLDTGEVLIKPTHHKLNREQLIAGITKKNCHSETHWGKLKGEEIW